MVLNPVISKLSGKLVVLASASPRRLEILRNTGLRFEVVPSWFKETLDKGLYTAPHEYAVETAKQKALEVARRMPIKHLKTPDIVIGADTIVSVDGMILEKPVDKHDAYRMLSSLSGKEHSVFTGVAIVLCHEKENDEVDYQLIDFYEETKVKFADLSEDMLWEYINSGEPMDKAGGYGIQALGGMLVEYVHGDFLNVVGFPLNHFCKQLDLIYNRCTSSSDQESASARLSKSSPQSTSVLSQLPHNLTDPSSQSPSSSAKHNSSNSIRPNSPTASQTHHTHDSPSLSPVNKVKKKDGDSEGSESSRMLVNNFSKDRGAEIIGSDNTTLPLIPSRGQMIELNVAKQEDSEPKREDLQRVMELMDGFKASKALFTASKLCVFDLLHRSPGLDSAQMAQEIKASVKGTECLLEACVSLGLLKSKDRTSQKPVYENTDLAGRFLRSDAAYSLHGYIQHCNNTVWPLFSHLESAVVEGSHQHEKAFGKKTNNLFQDTYYNNQEIKLRFMRAMHSIAKVTGKDVATAFDLSTFRTACDLGGCTGAMAYEFTKAHPGLSVTVFDLPAVVEMIEHFRPQHKDNRVSFVAGDFFQDELPKADLYILARILHDWSDEKVHTLLGKIAQTCKPGCALLIAETMLDGLTPYSALQSLNMLTQTEGIERTESKLLTPPRGAAEEERNSSGFKDFSGFLLTPPSALPSPALHVDLFLVIPCQTIFPGLRDCACMCIGIRITWGHRGATSSFKQSLKSRSGAWGRIDGGMDVGVEPSLDGRQHLRAHLKPGGSATVCPGQDPRPLRTSGRCSMGITAGTAGTWTFSSVSALGSAPKCNGFLPDPYGIPPPSFMVISQ